MHFLQEEKFRCIYENQCRQMTKEEEYLSRKERFLQFDESALSHLLDLLLLRNLRILGELRHHRFCNCVHTCCFKTRFHTVIPGCALFRLALIRS